VNAPRSITLGAVVVSLLVVPGALTYLLNVHGPPPAGDGLTILGLVALLPGFLMGGAALCVSAHG